MNFNNSNPFNKQGTLDKQGIPSEAPIAEEPMGTITLPTKSAAPAEELPADTYGTLSSVVLEDEGKAKSKTGEPLPFKPEDTLPILDSLLQSGYALDTFQIRKINVVLRSRFGWEEEAGWRAFESVGAQVRAAQDRSLMTAMLAGSLVEYGPHKFPPINTGTQEELNKSYQDRLTFVNSLPALVITLLLQKLTEFEAKQAYVAENFDSLTKDF